MTCGMQHSPKANTTLALLVIILSNDIQVNPGPNASIYPCGLCDVPVTWNCEGVGCDGCSIWCHKSCVELCSEDYSLLNRSNVQWLCCRCDSINCNSFTFRSFEIEPSYYSPLLDVTVDSISSLPVFSPLKTSSPTLGNTSENSEIRTPARGSRLESSPIAVPAKKNLRILNINCRSVFEKQSEFKAAIDYIKPDIVCGTESWLKGIKPGKTPTPDAIKSSEVFPNSYKHFRNDRGTLGGGVFILVHEDIVVSEQVEAVSDCEIVWVKIKLHAQKDLFVGSYYMPHREMKHVDELELSLSTLCGGKEKHLILCGDFNCPDIDWNTMNVAQHAQDRPVQSALAETATRWNLSQVHEHPTRGENLLDLYF
jgi:hypothetical protein